MKLNKILIYSILPLLISLQPAIAQDMKPFAPPVDITTKSLEKASILSVPSFKSDKESLKPDLEEEKETFKSDDIDAFWGKKEDKVSDKDTLEEKIPYKDNIKAISSPATSDKSEIASMSDQSVHNTTGLISEVETLSQQADTISSTSNTLDTIDSQTSKIKDDFDIEGSNSSESGVLDLPRKETYISASQRAQLSNIQKQADEINLELRIEEPEILNDLRVLWAAAVEKSTTIRLAIQKLSNPNEGEKGEDSMVSRILSPLASMAPIAALATGTPTQTAGALLGGGMLGTLTSDVDSEYNRSLLRVSDFDLIMLAKAVDELQAKLVVTYYEYRQAYERLVIAEEALLQARKHYEEAKNSGNFASESAADAFYREAVQNHHSAKQNFISARTALEQISGNNAIVYVETMQNKQEEESAGAEEMPADSVPLQEKAAANDQK